MKKTLSLPLLAALLLNSCITQSNIGAVIRDRPTTDNYADTKQVVGDVAYQVSPTEYVQQVPVYSTRTTQRFIFFNFFDEKLTSPIYIAPPQNTGELCWIKLSKNKPATGEYTWYKIDKNHPLAVELNKTKRQSDHEPTGLYMQVLEQTPSLTQAKKIKAFPLMGNDTTYPNAIHINRVQGNDGKPSIAQSIAAAPFNYVIDPVLTVPLTATSLVVGILGSPVIIFNSFSSCSSDETP